MSDERIAPEVVEAAIGAMRDGFRAGVRYGDLVEAAIRAADKARGLREERTWRGVWRWGVGPPTHVRLVSDWRPVERPS